MSFDNRRSLIQDSSGLGYLDSRPHKTMGDCKLARLFAGLSKIKFDASVPIPNISGSGSNSVKFDRVLLRMRIRLIYQYPEYFGFNPIHQVVRRTEVKEIINGKLVIDGTNSFIQWIDTRTPTGFTREMDKVKNYFNQDGKIE